MSNNDIIEQCLRYFDNYTSKVPIKDSNDLLKSYKLDDKNKEIVVQKLFLDRLIQSSNRGLILTPKGREIVDQGGYLHYLCETKKAQVENAKAFKNPGSDVGARILLRVFYISVAVVMVFFIWHLIK